MCVLTGETFPIKLEVVSALSTFAIIRWANFHPKDTREILSWVVNYREVYVLTEQRAIYRALLGVIHSDVMCIYIQSMSCLVYTFFGKPVFRLTTHICFGTNLVHGKLLR